MPSIGVFSWPAPECRARYATEPRRAPLVPWQPRANLRSDALKSGLVPTHRLPVRYLSWIVRIALFLLVLAFALENSQVVAVQYFVATPWQAPLVVVILLCFALGAGLGILAVIPAFIRMRREISLLQRQIKAGRPDLPPSEPPQ